MADMQQDQQARIEESQEQEVNLQLVKDVEQRLKLFLKQNLTPGLDVTGPNFGVAYDKSLGSEILVSDLTAKATKPSKSDGIFHNTPILDEEKSAVDFVRVNIKLDLKSDQNLLKDIAEYKKGLPFGVDVNADMIGDSFPQFKVKQGSYDFWLYNIRGDITGPNAKIFMTSARSDIENGNKPDTVSVYLPKTSYERIKLEAVKG